VSQMSDKLDAISNQIRLDFTAQDAAREKAIPLCREVIRYCSSTIRAVHRREMTQAKQLLAEARRLLDEIESHLSGCHDLQNTHFYGMPKRNMLKPALFYVLLPGKISPLRLNWR